MNIRKNKIIIALLLSHGLYTTIVFSQNSNKSSYNWFDSQMGDENSEIYNGILFIDNYKVGNEKHRFFETTDFILGNIAYNGNIYYDQRLKYDLLNDELLVRPKKASEAMLLQVVKSKIDSFSLGERKFLRLDSKDQTKQESFFYEVMGKKNTLLLLKRNKKVNEGKKFKKIYFEFRSKNKTFILFENVLHPVSGKSDLIALFPEHKKIIKEYYISKSRLKKSNPDDFMRFLIDEIEISNKN
tara:strand:- start:74357 stop:75082 length:726 start_codon:yes stop_codon:yes gene_type:complete